MAGVLLPAATWAFQNIGIPLIASTLGSIAVSGVGSLFDWASGLFGDKKSEPASTVGDKDGRNVSMGDAGGTKNGGGYYTPYARYEQDEIPRGQYTRGGDIYIN